MFYVLSVLFVSVCLSYVYERYNKKFFLGIMWLNLVLFSGLHTVGIDTRAYITDFEIQPLFVEQWIIGNSPLYTLFMIFVKRFVSESANVFLLCCAIFIITSDLLFLKRYSSDFTYSVFVFIGMGYYASTMGVIRQAMATSIAIWAIPLLIKKNYIRAMALIVVASLIHEYAFIILICAFLTKHFKTQNIICLYAASLLIGIMYEVLLTHYIGFASYFGKRYDEVIMGEGVNIFRVLVYLLIPTVIFLCYRGYRSVDGRFSVVAMNIPVVVSAIMVISAFGGAILIGRISAYFNIIGCISVPIVIEKCVNNEKTKRTVKIIGVIVILVFYFIYYLKYEQAGLGPDYYKHISLAELIQNW